jgi:hypothetical protein
MTEWLTLLVVVPAVVAPIVLLFGFAGCASASPMPDLMSVVGTGTRVMTLTWEWEHAPAEKFEFLRTHYVSSDGETSVTITETFEATASPFEDLGLDTPGDTERLIPGTFYSYKVRAVFANGTTSAWSETRYGRTLPFQTAFEWRSEEQSVAADSPAWEGKCLVQRIEANRLFVGGTALRLTLRASSQGDASIERVYVSRADPAAGSDPYDAAPDIAPVTETPFVIEAAKARTLAPIDYTLDPDQALLIAVDFSAAPASAIRTVGQTPPEQALGHSKQSPGEASNPNRTGFTAFPGISLIEKIEVG